VTSTLIERVEKTRPVETEEEGAAEAGFTLIELMVVLLILAILMAIAIPTFLGVTGSANNRAAQSNLTNALVAAQSFYESNNQTFEIGGTVNTTALQSSLSTSEPTFSWNVGGSCASNSTNCISVAESSDGNAVALADYSKAGGGECWFIVYTPTESISTAFPYAGSASYSNEPSNPGTYYGETAASGSCNASNATSVANWASSFGQVQKA
jgi:type IV pilus assembly protein PilA